MVHLTYNGTERRKSAIEYKIRAYIPIYPKMLLQSVPNQPETIQNAGNNQPQRIPRGLYHDIMPEPIGAAMHHISPNSRNRPPNRADQISPNRSRQTGAACHGQPGRIFRGSPVRGVCSRFAVPLFVMPRKCFLRLSANFSATIKQNSRSSYAPA